MPMRISVTQLQFLTLVVMSIDFYLIKELGVRVGIVGGITPGDRTSTP